MSCSLGFEMLLPLCLFFLAFRSLDPPIPTNEHGSRQLFFSTYWWSPAATIKLQRYKFRVRRFWCSILAVFIGLCLLVKSSSFFILRYVFVANNHRSFIFRWKQSHNLTCICRSYSSRALTASQLSLILLLLPLTHGGGLIPYIPSVPLEKDSVFKFSSSVLLGTYAIVFPLYSGDPEWEHFSDAVAEPVSYL